MRPWTTGKGRLADDFYCIFVMVDDRRYGDCYADVSGKGVPAALFMVIGKTLIKDHTQPGRDLGEVFTEVNNILCESNETECSLQPLRVCWIL